MVSTGDSTVVFSTEQTSGGNVGTYKGRRFVSKEKAAGPTELKMVKNVDLEGLHEAMEEDSTAVDVLKREVLPIISTTR